MIDYLQIKLFFFLNLPFAGTIRSCPSSSLFIPVKLERKSARRSRKHIKECNGSSTDGEGPAAIKERSKRTQRLGQTRLKISKCSTAQKKRDEGWQGIEATGEGSQQSKVVDSCEDQASSVGQEKRLTCSVKEQPPSQETSRVPGENWAAAAIISVRGKNSLPDLPRPSASAHIRCHSIFYL